MRKKTVNHIADTIFWYILYFYPIIAYLIYLFASQGFLTSNYEVMNIIVFMDKIALRPLSEDNNIIFGTLRDLFGTNGILPLFSTNGVLTVMTYYVSVYIVHLAVDFILFIPRLCHKWLKAFTQGE